MSKFVAPSGATFVDTGGLITETPRPFASSPSMSKRLALQLIQFLHWGRRMLINQAWVL